MVKLVSEMTNEELAKEYYDLELESQHYDYQAEVHGDRDGYYAAIQRSIGDRMCAISEEECHRYDAESAHCNRLADEWEFEHMTEAA